MLEIALMILSIIAWIILLSVTAKKPEDPSLEYDEELQTIETTDEERLILLKIYRESYTYKIYELKKAYYELGQAIRDTFKKGE